MIVDTLVHEDAPGPRRVEVVSETANAPLKAAGAHGALLEEGGGEAALGLAQSSEGPDGILEVACPVSSELVRAHARQLATAAVVPLAGGH